MLHGEWCSPEIYKALDCGYKLVKIYYVLNYEEKFEYDINDSSKSLFGGYINKWFKIKLESSGYPRNVRTKRQRQIFRSKIFRREGIRLDPGKIKINAGLRSLAKLMLNSLWGRFALDTNKIKTKILDTYNEWLNLNLDGSNEILTFRAINEHKMYVNYRKKDGFEETNFKGNTVIGSFVTAWARLVLYSELEVLGTRVLYFDTDSIIYTYKEGEYEPPFGAMLGDWQDEITDKYGSDVTILQFVATGPKSYALKLSNGMTIVKMKGLYQNRSNSSIISFRTLNNFVQAKYNEIGNENVNVNGNEIEQATSRKRKAIQPISVPINLNMKRDKYRSEIYNRPTKKVFNFNYTKRMKLCDTNNPFITYPYGYTL
jgi:hypothetical protein